MRRAIRLSILSALVCCLSQGGSVASAQTALSGFQVGRFEPTAAGEWSFAVEHPWYSSTRYFAAGVTLDYAHNPLVLGLTSSDGFQTTRPLIGNLFIAHIDLAGSFLDRILVTASLPVTLAATGDSGQSPAVSDPRIGFLARVFGQPNKSILSINLGADLWIPLRAMNDSLPSTSSDKQVRILPKAVFAGIWRKLMWSATFGFLYRLESQVADLPFAISADAAGHVGSELQFGFAASYYDAERRFAVGPELLIAATVTGASAFTSYGTSVEALVTAHYNVARLVQVGLAAGAGFVREPGTPDFRMLARVAYAPMPRRAKDTDGDGIPDDEDACMRVKGIRTGDPMTHGCPPLLPDRDGDGVLDRDDLCPDVPQGPRPDANRQGCPAPSKVIEMPVDRDGDGILDKDDACPDVPKGPQPDPNRVGCPAQDSDKDGVIDPLDQCLFEPAGLYPDPARAGCPLPDRDGDSVPDPQDACPDKPGAPSPYPKRNGCPGLVELKGGQIVILKPVFFATDKDVILNKSYPVLQAVADVLDAVPSIKHLHIEGHSDSQGKFDHNLELSDRRAQSVKRWLVSRSIGPDRLDAKGYGQTRPIASNKTAAGRGKNRRVEFHIVDGSASAQSSEPAGKAAEPAQKSVEPAQKPVEPVQKPLEPVQKSVEPTKKSVEPPAKLAPKAAPEDDIVKDLLSTPAPPPPKPRKPRR